MKIQFNKQRIIGAIIVIIFLVLAVPFLMAGNKPSASVESSQAEMTLPVPDVTSNSQPQVQLSTPNGEAVVAPQTGNVNSVSQQPAGQEPVSVTSSTPDSNSGLPIPTITLSTSSEQVAPTQPSNPGVQPVITPSSPTSVAQPPQSSVQQSQQVQQVSNQQTQQPTSSNFVPGNSVVKTDDASLHQAIAKEENDIVNNGAHHKKHASKTKVKTKPNAKTKTTTLASVATTNTKTIKIKSKQLTEAQKETAESIRIYAQNLAQGKKNQHLAVRVGPYYDNNHAKTVVSRLKKGGYTTAYAKSVTTKHGVFMRVYVGPEASAKVALKTAKKIKQLYKVETAVVS